MKSRISRLMKAYVSGRKEVLLAVYAVLVSTIRDSVGPEYSDDELKSAVANVINRMTFRPETRPDPRLAGGTLARELLDVCGRQMVKEAVALVLILDVCAGDIDDLEAANSRLLEAERLAGPDCASIRARLDPRTADPFDVEAILADMAGSLAQISNYSVFDEPDA